MTQEQRRATALLMAMQYNKIDFVAVDDMKASGLTETEVWDKISRDADRLLFILDRHLSGHVPAAPTAD